MYKSGHRTIKGQNLFLTSLLRTDQVFSGYMDLSPEVKEIWNQKDKHFTLEGGYLGTYNIFK